ncbi:hypothetical protein [Kiloniella majae]|uniref:hypothetical protein n=1 Tax=Kiloniella majae TaxID=1938558 RepID=UPI0015C4FD2B|nr:hypothetical protein [Kiloniella majae]
MSNSSQSLMYFANSIDMTLRSQQGSGEKIAELLNLHEKAPESDRFACTCALVTALISSYDTPKNPGSSAA